MFELCQGSLNELQIVFVCRETLAVSYVWLLSSNLCKRTLANRLYPCACPCLRYTYGFYIAFYLLILFIVCLFVFLFIYRDYTTVSCIAGNIGKEFRLAIILPYNGTYYCVF